MMTLPVEQTPDEREQLLSAIALRLNFDPGVPGGIARSLVEVERYEPIEQELRQKLNLRKNDFSEEARFRIVAAAGDEISASLNRRLDAESAKRRIADRGLLPPNQYQISFTPQFRERQKLGVSRTEVAETVKSPDIFQHFGAVTDDEGSQRISIFCKRFPRGKYRGEYTVLVEGQRDGFSQKILGAWLVFHDDVDLTHAITAPDVLAAFVRKYGVRFRTDFAPLPVRFLLRETLPLNVPPGMGKLHFDGFAAFYAGICIFRVDDPARKADKLTAEFLIKVSDLGVIEVALAFIVDLGRYEYELKKRGVRIKG